MSLGLHHQRTQARRRRRWLLVKWLLAVAIIVALGLFSYQTGSELSQRDVSRLKREVETLSQTGTELRDRNVQLQAEAETARRREAQWRRRYEAEVPTGKSSELLALIEAQIKKGADPERIAFMVGAAAKARSCSGAPRSKRFLVRTPIYVGANDSVSFANNAITVMAHGAAATNDEGKPEAWFDPAKPVNIQFIELGGADSEASGPLPLFHSVVRGNEEYRFSITAGETRGFIIATAQRCAFP